MNADTGFIPVVRRWWRLLLLGTLGAALVANIVARLESPTYASTATLLVGPLNADYATTQAAGDLGRTYADLARTLPVLTGAVRRADAPVAPLDLGKKVTSSSNDVTRLVTIKVEASSPTRAASLANALGAQLIAISRRVSPQETDSIRSFMTQREVASLSSTEQDAVRAAAVRVFGAGVSGRLQMMAPAVPSADAVAPNLALLTALGAVAGLALAAVAALFLTAPGGRERADARSATDVPFLGSISRRPADTAADYRLLAAKIGLLGDRRPRSLAVLGAGDRQAGGVVATNLATVLADGGMRVLVVDAGCGTATSLLGLEGRPGYTELVRKGATTIDDGLRVAHGERLFVVPIGEDGKASLLEGEGVRRLLDGLEETADVVLLSVPPADVSPVGLVWASLADGTLLVDGGTRAQDAVREAARGLELVGANLLGTVAWRGGRARVPWLLPRRSKTAVAA